MTLEQIGDIIAQRLADTDVAYFNPTGNYPTTTSRPPIFLKRFPAHAPHKALSVIVYADEESLNPADDVRILHFQVKARAPYDADPLADQAKAALTAIQTHWGDLYVSSCIRTSFAQLGADQDNVDMRSDNYQLITTRG